MRQKRSDNPKMTNGLVQYMTIEESASIQWVNVNSFPSVFLGTSLGHLGKNENGTLRCRLRCFYRKTEPTRIVLCIMPHLKHDTSIANSVKAATK